MNKVRKIILMLDSSRAADRGIIRGIMEYCHLRGNWSFYQYQPRFRTPPFSYKQSETILERLQKFDADGIIGYIPSEKNLIASIQKKKFPAVALPVQQPIEGMINIQQDENVGSVGAEHFLERGFKHFAFCATLDFWSTVRQQGFCRRIRTAGYDVQLYTLGCDSKTRDFELAMLAGWLEKLPKPVAIMAPNDEQSSDLIEACHLVDLKVPEQVAILGVDNDEMICGLSNPPISSIKLNFENVGYQAAKSLDNLISAKITKHPKIVFQSLGVVTRQSTDILAIEDEYVVSAIRFIRNNARRDIHVSDVVNQSCLSIRALQQRFRKALGRGINQEIRQLRIQQMAELLNTTNLPINQIAHDLGFKDINHISRIFRKEMQLTPAEYRKRFGYDSASV